MWSALPRLKGNNFLRGIAIFGILAGCGIFACYAVPLRAQVVDNNLAPETAQISRTRIESVQWDENDRVFRLRVDAGAACDVYSASGSRLRTCFIEPGTLLEVRFASGVRFVNRLRATVAGASFAAGEYVNVYGELDRANRRMRASVVRSLDRPSLSRAWSFSHLRVKKILADNPAAPRVIAVPREPSACVVSVGTASEVFPCPPSGNPSGTASSGAGPGEYEIVLTTRSSLVNRYRQRLLVTDLREGDELFVTGVPLPSGQIEASVVQDLAEPRGVGLGVVLIRTIDNWGGCRSVRENTSTLVCAPVTGATVTMKSGTGRVVATKTALGDVAFFENVLPGAYEITVAAKGWPTLTRSVRVAPGTVLWETVTLTQSSRAVAVKTAGGLKGTVGKRYQTFFEAVGESSSFSWSLVGGALPPGLRLGAPETTQRPCYVDPDTNQARCPDNAYALTWLTGTPTKAGEYGFRLRAVSANGGWGEADFTAVISRDPSAPQGTLTIESVNLSGRVYFDEDIVTRVRPRPVKDGGRISVFLVRDETNARYLLGEKDFRKDDPMPIVTIAGAVREKANAAGGAVVPAGGGYRLLATYVSTDGSEVIESDNGPVVHVERASLAPVNIDLRVNGSAGPLTVSEGDSLTVSWRSERATDCVSRGTGTIVESAWAGTSRAPTGNLAIPAARGGTVPVNELTLECRHSGRAESDARRDTVDLIVLPRAASTSAPASIFSVASESGEKTLRIPGEKNVVLATFLLKAEGGDVVVRRIDIASDSSGAFERITNLRLRDPGSERPYGSLANLTRPSGKDTLARGSFPLTLPLGAGESKRIVLVGDIPARGTGGPLRLGFVGYETESAVRYRGESTVWGREWVVAPIAAVPITIEAFPLGATTDRPRVSSDDLARISFTASSQADAQITSLRLSLTGTAMAFPESFGSFELYDPATRRSYRDAGKIVCGVKAGEVICTKSWSSLLFPVPAGEMRELRVRLDSQTAIAAGDQTLSVSLRAPTDASIMVAGVSGLPLPEGAAPRTLQATTYARRR